MFEATVTGWAITVVAIAALIGFDLWHSRRRPHAIGLGEAAAWSVFYVVISVLFGVVFGIVAGWHLSAQYFAGYIVEKSLSIDNLFVFVVIMSTFAVPAERQARLLMLGIVGALVLRAIFIALGAALLAAFSVGYLLFGLVLLVTAVQLFRHRHRDPSVKDNPLVAAVRRRFPVTDHYHGDRLIARSGGRLLATPLLLALVAIASTDVVFAFDSIPAVFGVTQHAYIVFVANAFALLGLRALFFVISGLLERLVHLSVGLAVILAFIGVKLILHFAHLQVPSVPELSTGVSLGIIALVLAFTAAASLLGMFSGSEKRSPNGNRQRQARARGRARRDPKPRLSRRARAAAPGRFRPR